jgi:hypothetical protein
MARIWPRRTLKTNYASAIAVILAIPVVLAGLAAAQETAGEGGWCRLFSGKRRPTLYDWD